VPSPDDLARTLAELTPALMAPQRRDATAREIVSHAVTVVPAAEISSITVPLRRGRAFHTVAATHPTAETCDELQYELGAGPCVSAATGAGLSSSEDVLVEDRWAGWGPRAGRTGVRSVMSLSLTDGQQTLAALNLYSSRKRAFDDGQSVEAARLYAVHAGAALSAATQIGGLDEALDSRHLIGVAQGILMERFGLSVDGAFHVLQRYSNSSNVKLREVAASLVATRQLPDERS
jgi:hypothetical protein